MSLRQGGASLARRALDSNPSLPLALLAVLALLTCATSDAGYYPTTWYPTALFVAALLALGLVVLRARVDAERPSLAAIILLVAFAAWSYLSITWAEDQATAWDGANRAALYAAILALASLWRLDARGARWLLGAVGLGLAAIGLYELLRASSAHAPGAWFIDARFSEPAGYINANVALWSVGLIPCAMLASAREARAVVRGLALGAAGLLGALALLGQSRGWAVAFPIALAVYVLISPHRVRTLVPLLLVAGGVLSVARPILAVDDRPANLARAISDAAGDIVLMSAALTVVGMLLALADRASAGRQRAIRAARTGVAVTVLGVAIVGAGAALIHLDDLNSRASDTWQEFKTGESDAPQGASRFSTGETNRYDFWVVAVDLFEEHPWRGIGSGNFQADYLRLGSSYEEPRFPHSLWLGVLSQTGVVGLALFVATLLAAGVSAARRLREGDPAVAAAAAAGGGVAAYWLLHASLDWFWEFPALTGLVLVLLGVAGSVGRDGATRSASRAPVIVALVGLGAFVLSCTGPWLSALDTSRAATGWPDGAERAYERLDRARGLNPLSPRPDLVAGTIALRVDDLPEAEQRFKAALRRQPRISYALLQLGLIAATRGKRAEGERLLRAALRENPRSEIVRGTLSAVRSGRSVNIGQVGDQILDDARSRVQ